MKKFIKIIVCMLGLVPCMCVNVFAAESGETRITGEIHSPVNIVPAKICYAQDNIDVSIEIPVIWGLKDKNVQRNINLKIYDEIMNFKEGIEKDDVQYVKDSKEYKYPINRFSIYANYNIHFCSKDVLSLTLDEYGYEGGAHGSTERKSYNIKLNNGKELSYEDIFKDDSSWKKVISDKIKKEMVANKDIYFKDSVKNFTTIKDTQPFYIEDGNIIVYFEQYEIAPYAAGIREFKIPLKTFSYYMK